MSNVLEKKKKKKKKQKKRNGILLEFPFSCPHFFSVARLVRNISFLLFAIPYLHVRGAGVTWFPHLFWAILQLW